MRASFIGGVAAAFSYFSSLGHFGRGGKGPRPVYNRQREKDRRRRQDAKIAARWISEGRYDPLEARAQFGYL